MRACTYVWSLCMCVTGTGTPAGDPVEVKSLGTFFKQRGHPKTRYIGSVKTNIGHTESAAGIMGLIKVLLMMKNNKIVPSLHCEVVNPKLDMSGHGFVVPNEVIPWPNPHKIAACNSFGFGGSNAHAVVSSFTAHDDAKTPKATKHCIVCFSGKTKKSLKGSLEDFYTDEEAPLLEVHDVSYTSTVRRDHYPYRVAFVVDSMEGLVAAVGERLSGDHWDPPVSSKQNVVFVFCGMGTAWEGMCRQLLSESQLFKVVVMAIEKHLSMYVSWSLTERLETEDPSRDPLLAPIAIFACQVGLAAVWQSFGVKPSCVVGQSIGEVAAAFTAGCLALSDAVKIILLRSQLLAQVTGGAMVVVQNVDTDLVRQVLSEAKIKATIALEYSPRACAVSASSQTMKQARSLLLNRLKEAHSDMRLIDLDVCVAYHSPHVDGAANELYKEIQGMTAKTPHIPMVSSVTGQHVTAPLLAGHWADNVKKPVLFHQAMKCTVAGKGASNTVFLEIGPKPVLKAHMQDLFPDGPHKAVASVTKQSEMKGLFQGVATLYESGVGIDWTQVPQQGQRLTPVPRYSFDKKYVKLTTERQLFVSGGFDVYTKNHLFVYPTDEKAHTFRVLLSPLTVPSVYQHIVMGRVVIPGAMYAECGFAVANYIMKNASVSVSAEFHQLLALPKDEVDSVQILPDEKRQETDATQKHFVILKKDRKLAAIHLKEVPSDCREPVNLDLIRSKCTEKVSKAQIYDTLSTLGFEYGTAFSLVGDVQRNSSECLAILQLNDEVRSEMRDTTLHPSVLDGMLQPTAALIWLNSNTKEVLPKSINGLRVYRKMENVMYVHCRMKTPSPRTTIFELRLLSRDGHVIAEVMDFTVQVLRSSEENYFPNMLTEKWEKVKEISLQSLTNNKQAARNRDPKSKILVVSELNWTNHDSSFVHLKYDSMDKGQNLEKSMEALAAKQPISALVLLISMIDPGSQSAETMQSRLINICLLIQCALKVLKGEVPLYMCTSAAWPSVSGSSARVVDPTATALWGLLRTALAENVYGHIVSVEFHMSLPQNTMKSLLQPLIDLLTTDSDLCDYPEILITEEAIYVNQVTEVNESTTVPEKRQTSLTSMKDVPGSALILSENPAELSNLQAVCHEPQTSPANQVKLTARSFAQPHQSLFSTRVPAAHLLPEVEESSSDLVLMALEVTGNLADDPSAEMTSCCPLAISSTVSVPTDTSLATSSLPHYQPGDLSKLVLFWSMVDLVPTQRFTVLASGDCLHVAKLVKLLSCEGTDRTESDVNIVMVEDLKEGKEFHESLLSLVLVDVEVMACIASNWRGAHSLISISSLVTKDLQAFIACTMPDVQICHLDTQQVYQLRHLKQVMPKIKNWISHTSLMPEMSEYLHYRNGEDNDTAICSCLQFRTICPHDLSVRLKEEKLFKKNGIYLMVGGLTGLGWICVEFLAQNNAGFIAIINRRAPSPEQSADMHNLSTLHGCKIESFQADITSMESLKQVMQRLSNGWLQSGQLKGVFTGAAVLQDGFFASMDRPAFEKVLSPKVQGTWNLHLLTKDLSLDYFVMHSSVASVLGNHGQANYSAANAFLDGLAFHRRQLGLAAQSINWGPLDTGLLDSQDEVKTRLMARGFEVASLEEIKASLPVLMLLDWPQSVPVTLIKEAYTRQMKSSLIKSLIKRFHNLMYASSQQTNTEDMVENAGKIRLLDASQRLPKYEDFVREVCVRLLACDRNFDNDVRLLDLGLDSVTGMMLINITERYTSFKLSAVDVLGGDATASSLAQIMNRYASESA